MSTDSSNDTPLITLKNVGVSYWLRQSAFKRKAFWALKDVSFDVYRGESIGVVGRNGCGKSTLLRMLADVMAPDHGEIIFNESPRISLLSLQIGFVNYLSGRENALLSGMFLGMKKRDVLARMDEIIAFSELGEFIDQPLSSYSSGMRARLGFSVAFQVNPDILLVDEVTGVGDASFREKSFVKMKERMQSRENTIIFVSHQAQQIRNFCDRAVWIEDGVVKREGQVDKVLKAYEDAQLGTVLDTEEAVTFVREEGTKKIFIVRNGRKRRLKDWQEFLDLGGRSEEIQILPHEIIQQIRVEKSPK